MSEYKLIGHETYLEKFITLYENNNLPNKNKDPLTNIFSSAMAELLRKMLLMWRLTT